MNCKTKKNNLNSKNQAFYQIDEVSIDKKDLSIELIKPSEKSNQKKDNIPLKNDVEKFYHLSYLKICKKYNSTPRQYQKILVDYLLRNADCHLVSIFKERMLSDYIAEFLRREYDIIECRERLPKFSGYYKNYLQFFCKPTYNNFKFNEIIQNYGQKKAELYYKNNYQGGVSNDDDNGFEESSSDESSDKDEYEFNNINNREIFNKIVKEKIDNVTVMTTINSTGNNTINLNLNKEKIEVFSENKAEESNDTTINDLMEDIRKETKKLIDRKKDALKNKYKNSYKKIYNYSLKKQGNNRSHKNLSIETKEKNTSNDYYSKYNKRINSYKDKIINNEKMLIQKLKSLLFKYNIESNRIKKTTINRISQNKMQKLLKRKYSKNGYSNISQNPDFNRENKINLKNASSNIKSPDNKTVRRCSNLGLSGKQFKSRSRNNYISLYKNVTVGTNSTTNKNTNINFQTSLINRNRISNLSQYENNVYKTMNFMKTVHHQRTNSQLINQQSKEKNSNRFLVQNINREKKTSSLKKLVTDSNNPAFLKPTIKIKKNERFKTKYSYINNIKNKNIINNNENNLNNKITVTTNENLNHRNSKKNLKKTFVDSTDRLAVNNHNNTNLGNYMYENKLLTNKGKSETSNKKTISNNYQTKSNDNLMQIALSFLIESNSPSKQNNQNSKNSLLYNGSSTLNDKNNIKNKKIINQKNFKNNYNNINMATHYNININNNINININNKGSKKKNKSNKNIIRHAGIQQRKNLSKNKIAISTSSINKLIYSPCVNNNKIKIKTRNYNDSLKGGFTQNYNDKNEKVIKGYHTKSVSNIIDLINHNKKIISLYKSKSKSKSKEKEII